MLNNFVSLDIEFIKKVVEGFIEFLEVINDKYVEVIKNVEMIKVFGNKL